MKESVLQKTYQRFNRQHFYNELPTDVSVSWTASVNTRDWVGHAWKWEITNKNCPAREKSFIKINKRVRWAPAIWELVLLHEMCHLYVWKKWGKNYQHGTRFKKEMLRVTKETNCRYL